ncbi:MAG: hypothetical protein ABSE73_21970 [Planctomycetota bacterium]
MAPGFCSSFFTLLSPPGMAVFIGRWQSFFAHHHLYPLAKLLAILNVVLFSFEMGFRSEIDEGLAVCTPLGVGIHNNTRIGKNCVIAGQVSFTIGPRLGLDEMKDRIVLEDEVLVGPGARIVGNVVLGHHSLVMANAVVTSSAPPYSLLEGVPARVVGSTDVARPFGSRPDPAEKNT